MPQQTPLTDEQRLMIAELADEGLAVLEDWTTPAYRDDAGTPMEMKRFRVRVTGPLPGRPSKAGEFGMIVRRYGD